MLLAALLASLTFAAEPEVPYVPRVEPGPPIPWPLPGAALKPLDVQVPPGFKRRTIMVNAGHGAHQNSGSLSVFCTWEMDFTYPLQNELADWLEATGAFKVLIGRPTEARLSYYTRLEQLEASSAELMLDLHADTRDGAHQWEPAKGKTCARNDTEPGFSILFNDDNPDASLVATRRQLARATASSMAATGFPIYNGSDYTGMYEFDAQPGVYLDRRGLLLLRAPKVPSIIIETHHHIDLHEHKRWQEPQVREAFYRAVFAALVEYFEPGSTPLTPRR